MLVSIMKAEDDSVEVPISTTENCKLCGIIVPFCYSSHPSFLTPCSSLISALTLSFLREKVANWCTCYPLIYNCIYLFSCKELLTNYCSSVAPPASISFRSFRAKLNFLKKYCIFLLLGQKKNTSEYSFLLFLLCLCLKRDCFVPLKRLANAHAYPKGLPHGRHNDYIF